LNIQISQGSATTDLNLGGSNYFDVFRALSQNVKVKKNIKIAKSVYYLPKLS